MEQGFPGSNPGLLMSGFVFLERVMPVFPRRQDYHSSHSADSMVSQ